MLLPNALPAVIDEHKLREYLLSRTHPTGRFKAALFARLGYTPDRWRDLRSELRTLAINATAEPAESSAFGRKFLTHGTLRGLRGPSAAITVVWIVLSDEDRPRLVTVCPRQEWTLGH